VVKFEKGQVRRGKENWEGEAPAEPKLIGKSAGRQMGKSEGQKWRLAISDWRLVKRQRVANGE
jgi:hypothetical protein